MRPHSEDPNLIKELNLMKTVTYIGPYPQGVEIEPNPKTAPDVWAVVRPGESVDCAGSVTDSLILQECWELTDGSPIRPPARKAPVAEWQAFVDEHDLDRDGRDATERRTKDELIALVEAALNPSNPDPQGD